MFLPIGDDNPSVRTPYVTWGLVGVNVLIFLAVNRFGTLPMRSAMEYGLVPSKAVWYTFVTSVFLHGDFMHILGNMIYLVIAGDNVEDKLGHVGFLIFYLVAGVAASGFYMMFAGLAESSVPLVGASGAIAGVLGCYMIFFPRAKIRIFYWVFVLIGVVHMDAIWFLGIWVAMNVFSWLILDSAYVTGVAYAAHVGGFAVGVIAAVLLREHLRKRGSTRADIATGFASTVTTPSATPVRPRSHERAFVPPRIMTEREDEQFFGREEAIAQNVKDGRVDLALERYDDYVSMRHAKPLPPWAQIEIAGELYRRGDYEGALRAYRRYLASYPTGPDAPEAKFRLGIILSRHMREYFRAREYLVEAVMEHTDSSIVDFARNELQRIEALL